MMQKHFLTVPKTARYFTQVDLTQKTKYIWIVIHGYAQTADSFLNSFEILGDDHFIIAPCLRLVLSPTSTISKKK